MLRSLTTAALLLFAVASSQAQPSGGPQPATGVPIDGGASLLLAGGAGYIIRKLKQRRRAQ